MMILRSLISQIDLKPNEPDFNIYIVNGQTSAKVVTLYQGNSYVVVPAELIDHLATLMHEVHNEATSYEGVLSVQEVQ